MEALKQGAVLLASRAAGLLEAAGNAAAGAGAGAGGAAQQQAGVVATARAALLGAAGALGLTSGSGSGSGSGGSSGSSSSSSIYGGLGGAVPLAEERATLAAAAVVALAAGVLLLQFLAGLARFVRRELALRPIPSAPGGNFLLGHALAMLRAPERGYGAWDLIEQWAQGAKGGLCRFRILGTHSVVVADPMALKRVFQTRFKVYAKDLRLSYHPFLPILGTGLVTADGDLWQKQRLLMAPALRVDILDDIIPIAKRAVDRLSARLEAVRGTGAAVHLEEEFRLLTLEVIGEAILSLPPDECGRVFPQLYLPVMEEANRRVLRPHRKYLPTPDWFRFRARMRALNAYLVGVIRARWAARAAGRAPARSADILDRILAAIEVRLAGWLGTAAV